MDLKCGQGGHISYFPVALLKTHDHCNLENEGFVGDLNLRKDNILFHDGGEQQAPRAAKSSQKWRESFEPSKPALSDARCPGMLCLLSLPGTKDLNAGDLWGASPSKHLKRLAVSKRNHQNSGGERKRAKERLEPVP